MARPKTKGQLDLKKEAIAKKTGKQSGLGEQISVALSGKGKKGSKCSSNETDKRVRRGFEGLD